MLVNNNCDAGGGLLNKQMTSTWAIVVWMSWLSESFPEDHHLQYRIENCVRKSDFSERPS